YYGSCKPLLTDLKYFGPPSFTREILEFCYTKKQLSYYEVKWQMLLNVLENDSYNENIQGKWFKRDTKQLVESQHVITD
ncbi:MAG: putative endonuclease segE, domain, partial [Bacteroidota bacterium]